MSPSTIHDFGGADPDRLDNPPLGGTGGWADAVRNDLVRLEAEKATDADVAVVAEAVPAAITDHEAKPDPHPVYLKPSEIVAGANITVTENAGVVTIAGQAGGGGGGASTLDDLTDVAAPPDTPAGKVLGTTAEGVWGPIDPPAAGGVGDAGWQSYVPVLGGWTLGNGTFTAKFRQVGQAVALDVVLTLGTTSEYTSQNPTISAPPDLPISHSSGDLTVRFHDAGTAWYAGQSTPSTDKFSIYARSLANGQMSTVGGTTPFAWTAGDQVMLSGVYYTTAPAIEGGAVALDALTDVTAPANTPAGKVLGTTAEGVWGPVDLPAGGGGGGGGNEVEVSDTEPTDPAVEWWINPSGVPSGGGGGGGGALKYAVTLGAVTGGTPITVTHNLGSSDVVVTIVESATGKVIGADVAIVDSNAVSVGFTNSAAADTYRVVVMG